MAVAGLLLGLLPALLLFLLPAGGIFPGERLLLRLVRRDAGDRAGEGAVARRLPVALHLVSVRGGRLIACSLSGRGPPALRATAVL